MGGTEEGPLPRESEAGRVGQSMTPWRLPQGRFLIAGTISPGHREGNEPTCMPPPPPSREEHLLGHQTWQGNRVTLTVEGGSKDPCGPRSLPSVASTPEN